MSQTKNSKKRNIGKSITYGIIGTALTTLIGVFLHIPSKLILIIGILELLLKPVIYYIHEIYWNNSIKFGLVIEKPKIKRQTSSPASKQTTEKKIKRLSYTKKTN